MAKKQQDMPLFVQLENEVLALWKAKETFKQSLEKNADGPRYVFYEGPPTGNAPPALHHVIARAFKDVMPRYQTMQGKYVERKAGWDTHGLPVELQIEKKLGISGKQDIENIVKGDPKASIKKFNEECKNSVWEFLKEWEAMTERMGYWVDMENAYVTYEPEYIETLWWIVQEFWNRGLLYKGHKVVPYCPRCGTALSAHEVAQGYKDVEEDSIYIKLRVRGEKDTYLLAWTTTPWTLPGNVALAVGEDETYVHVQAGKEVFIMAKDRVAEVLGDDQPILKELSGKDLVGMEYEPLFEIFTEEKGAYRVLAGDFVTTTDGTGIVHTAVMYGEDDYDLGVKENLPQMHTVDEEGTFKDVVEQWKGRKVKDPEVNAEITADLKARNLLLKIEKISHEYPHCWRCDTPLLYYARDSWFVKMSQVNKELLANNKTINWYPGYLKDGRFGEWLKEGKDWAFSRERYWGTPLPIWACDSCEDTVCVGSFEELKKLSDVELKDPHRPFIDEVTFPCKCGGTMVRDEAVCDVWFDSGSMPLAQHHYPFENREKIDSGDAFPADYICEAVDQTRGWFYTLLAVATALGKEAPYQNVISLGHLLDKHGKKMSKSKGNIINPWDMFDAYGADPLRFYMYVMSRPGDPKQFDEKGVDEVVKKVLLIWWNTLKFYQMYPAKTEEVILKPTHVMDKWVLARLNEVIETVTKDLDTYKITEAGRVLAEFVTDVSTWYVRRSRDRLKDEETHEEAAQTLYTVLREMAKLFAPFMPMISEAIYQKMELGESVHLEDWPKARKEWKSKKALEEMAIARQTIEELLSIRETEGIRTRQPLERAQTTAKLNKALQEVVANEVNVKSVEVVEALETSKQWKATERVSLKTELSPALKKEGMIRDLMRTVNDLRKKSGMSIEDRTKLFVQTQDKMMKEAIEAHEQDLLEATHSDAIEWGSAETSKQTTIQEAEIEIGLEKN